MNTTHYKKIASNKWVKLICGASNEDKGSIEDLCAIYAAAGVDYIDIAADPSVAEAARNGIDWSKKTFGTNPGLMISISAVSYTHLTLPTTVRV